MGTNGRAETSIPTTRLDCRVGPNGLGLGPDLLDDGLLDAGGWSVVVPRPGLRLYCPSVGKCPAESRYVSLVPLQRIRMILNSTPQSSSGVS